VIVLCYSVINFQQNCFCFYKKKTFLRNLMIFLNKNKLAEVFMNCNENECESQSFFHILVML